MSASTLVLLRRILGGDLAAVLAGPPPAAPTRWPSWPPRPWRSTSTAASARCARRPPFEPLRRLRPRPVLPGALRLLRLRHLHRPRPSHGALRRGLRPRTRTGLGAGRLVAPSSVFFGGGTPPASTPTSCAASSTPSARPGAEVTVECNPEDADDAHLGAYRRAGVTRVSSGCSRPTTTCWRVSVAATCRTRPRPSPPRCRRRLRHLEPRPHLRRPRRERRRLGRHARPCPRPRRTHRRTSSAYGLTVEPGTPLAPTGAPPRRGRAGPALRAGRAVLTAAGYRWEEISNWARPGHECRHNHLYWEQGDYVGIGSAAHSTATGTAGGTSARPTATSMPWRPGARPRPAARS